MNDVYGIPECDIYPNDIGRMRHKAHSNINPNKINTNAAESAENEISINFLSLPHPHTHLIVSGLGSACATNR